MAAPRDGWYRRWGKRVFDITAVLMASPVWLPLVGLLAIAGRVTNGRPILFRQFRPGFEGRPFELLKFRTMTGARDPEGRLLPDEQRLTTAGKFVRRASLDELPELFNVLRGEMSLVGPRPLLMQYLPRYTPEQARRHEVRPGITGWAQVNGRNALTWEEKFRLDVWYVDHCRLLVDLKILVMTFVKVLKGEGISARGHSTMPEFMGSETDAGRTDG
jgi:lipopolysaccharide/colanic/teichoic acid biosynthesis glycosyltransferase